MLNKIFGLAVILHSIQQPVQTIFLKFHSTEDNNGRFHSKQHNYGRHTFDGYNALLDYINKREGPKGYHWDECEFSPLSCLLRR